MAQENNKNDERPVLLIRAVLIVILMWVLCWFLLGDEEHRGTFGDMFGAVNALFSGLAFATLIYTVWMQKEELGLQREVLKATQEEMQDQKRVMEEQASTFKLQRFETTFFELLRVHGQIVEAMKISDGAPDRFTHGRDCFRRLHKDLNGLMEKAKNDPTDQLSVQRAVDVYNAFAEKHQAELGHYFRHLYHIVKFVRESEINDEKRYTNFVRAQLSSYELVLLFYNCLSDRGVQKFKPLVQDFALLKNLSPTLRSRTDILGRAYDARAYGSGYA